MVEISPNQLFWKNSTFTVCITINKNSVPKDKSALFPGGARLGAHPLTSRGFKEDDFKKVVAFVDQAVEIAKIAAGKTKTIKEYNQFIATDEDINAKCEALKAEVQAFALQFPMPGFENHWKKKKNELILIGTY